MTLSNEDVDLLADSLQEYIYLIYLDLSQNRLEGARGGTVITRLLSRHCASRGGFDIQHINLANNKLGSGGFSTITTHLIFNSYDSLTLNMAQNGIEEIHLQVSFNANIDLLFSVTNLILDGNPIKPRQFQRLAVLLAHASSLTQISFKQCKLGDDGLQATFIALVGLRKLTKVDYSSNNIFDEGIYKICPYIGKNIKSVLRTIKFNQNEISDKGV